MEYTDIITVAVAYLGLVAGVVGVPYAAWYLWHQFYAFQREVPKFD